MPALVNVKLNVIFVFMGVLSPELNVLSSSLVTVCGVCVVFFQITVVPALTVSVLGLKVKVPLLSVVIITVCVGPFVAVVAVAVGAIVAVGDSELVLEELESELLPHADKSIRLPNSRRYNKLRTERLATFALLCIIFPSSQLGYRGPVRKGRLSANSPFHVPGTRLINNTLPRYSSFSQEETSSRFILSIKCQNIVLWSDFGSLDMVQIEVIVYT